MARIDLTSYQGSAKNAGDGGDPYDFVADVESNFIELYGGSNLSGLATSAVDPASSKPISWSHQNDLNRGPISISSFEGGANDERSVLNANRVSPIAGVLIEYADSGCPLGNGTLTYTASGTTLSWAANGDSAGSAQNVGAGGFFSLASGTASRRLHVFVTSADLPVGNTAETVNVVATKPANGLFFIGHNGYTSGEAINQYDRFNHGYVIEHNWHDGEAMVSEFYPRVKDTYTGIEQRPWFLKFDRDNSRIKQHRLVGAGPNASTEGLAIAIDNGTTAGTTLWTFREREMNYLANWATAGVVRFALSSYSTYSSAFVMSANADSLVTNGTLNVTVDKAGASSQHRLATFSMRSNGSATHKTGAFILRGDDTLNFNAVSVGLGGGGGANALLELTHANMPTSYPTIQITGKAAQTRGVIEYIHHTGGERRWNLHTEGYIFVRESGNTTTNRIPGTGSSTVTQTDSGGQTITWTNKPGSNNRTTPTAWFPILDASGVLHWIPGWQD